MMKRSVCVFLVGLLCLAAPMVFAQDTAPAAEPATAEPAAAEPAPAAPAAPAASAEPAKAEPATGDPIATADAMVEKALAAYNQQDSKAFYADFAQSMAAIGTDQAFQSLYVGMYMKDFGPYKSRELLKDKCVVTNDAPVGLLQYNAVFEKNDKVAISVNITKEGDSWKLMQIQFNKQQ